MNQDTHTEKRKNMLSTLLGQYLVNLKNIWLPFLLFFSFLLIAFLISYFGIKATMRDFSASTNGEVTISLLGDFFSEKMKALKFDENLPIAMNNMFSFSWLKNTLSEFDEYVRNATETSEQFASYNEVYRENMLLCLRLSAITIILGIFLTNFITSFIIYKKYVKKKLSQAILGKIIDTLFISTLLSLTLGLTAKYHFSSLISFAVLLLVTTALYLMKSYFIFGKGKIKMKNAINLKSILLAILGQVILYAINFSVIAPIYFLLGALSSILLWIPLYIYTDSIIHTAFDYYIYSFEEA